MSTQFKPASRDTNYLRIAITGPSGAGKTLAALRLGYGLSQSWRKIYVIDTEHGSTSLYAGSEVWEVGEFLHLTLDEPFAPKRYIAAIQAAGKSGAECIIIDSASHAWDGPGGILEQKGRAAQDSRYNEFTAWSVVTPLQNAFMHAILTAPCHTIVTMRSKTEYVINQVNGRTVVEKVGMKPIQKPGIEYEFTTVLELDRATHLASANKDRTGIIGDQSLEIDMDLGNRFLDWLGTKSGATKEKPPSTE